MQATGYLGERTRMNRLGMIEAVDYEWIGGDVVWVDSWTAREPGEVIVVGPYHLRVLEWSIDRLQVRAVMESAWWPLAVYRAGVGRWLDLVYRRLVVTAAVWGIGRFERGGLPTWRDVYALDGVAKWWAKRRPKGAG